VIAATLPHTLTATEFANAIDKIQPTDATNLVAVFDCDGTLWSPDSGSGFMRYSVETGLLSRDAIDWLDQRYRKYLRGEVDELVICGEMVQVYQGLRDAELRHAAADFFAKRIASAIFPDLQRAVETLQSRGAEIWAVSSTNHWVVEEGVKRFNIPASRVLAARVAVTEGFVADAIVTDRLLHVPTDEGKVTALRRAGVHTPDAVFGNSIHDAAMLAIAHRAFPINPSPALIERSAKEHWPVFFPTL
jgi:phosphoserine phosphatase